ncbi:MAG: DUF3141 domain-containing protein [Desulforhopalus sp.]
MHTSQVTDTDFGLFSFFNIQEYLVDRYQRTILFWDVLRKRGNNYLSHLEAGQPPILIFDYEMVMDGRESDKPVNYALVRILDRRKSERRQAPREGSDRRQTTRHGNALDEDGFPARPIVIIDPRAGHGPGIGGSKLDSQIGIALEYGHPVYFVLFYPDPEPEQTIADVHRQEVKFLEKVFELHPDAPKPAIIGNCQAGWAAALIGADRPDLTGPLVFNGSPLSYWGGVEGANPMRYKGGLSGGVWLTSLWCDLGNGIFDGANLVSGFEDLNPANTFWSKYYYLFTNIDSEEERFLGFEKWWGGFYKMNSEEIHFIVNSLFIGNELEQGRLRLDDGRLIDLKKFRQPIFAFASSGDNITPPPQALNWIHKVYKTVDEIRRCGQVIIYMVHKKVGHLGIFVSGSVARKEHKQILGNMGWLDQLKPGLYEMVIEDGTDGSDLTGCQVRFEEREMEDILKLDDGLEDEHAFVPVNTVSRTNDVLYSLFLRPLVRMAVREPVAELIRQLHPLRMQRYLFADRNPLFLPVKWTAGHVKAKRLQAAGNNPFLIAEKVCSDSVQISLDCYRDMAGLTQEYFFKSIYENPLVKMFFGRKKPETVLEEQTMELDKKEIEREKARLRRAAEKGGFAEACVRVMAAVIGIDKVMDVREFQAGEAIIQGDDRLRSLSADAYKAIAREQAYILAMVPKKAIIGLGRMKLSAEDRQLIFRFAEKMVQTDNKKVKSESKILDSLKQILQIDDIVTGKIKNV